MPRKPKHPCAHPGCPTLTDSRFCPAHQQAENRRYEKYQRDPDTKKRYGKAWEAIRDRYVALHPLCEECKKESRLTPTQEVHHKITLANGGTHEENNLMSLCAACHSRITAREGGSWGSR